MKFLSMSFREAMADFFGKAGMPWHGVMFIRRARKDELVRGARELGAPELVAVDGMPLQKVEHQRGKGKPPVGKRSSAVVVELDDGRVGVGVRVEGHRRAGAEPDAAAARAVGPVAALVLGVEAVHHLDGGVRAPAGSRHRQHKN